MLLNFRIPAPSRKSAETVGDLIVNTVWALSFLADIAIAVTLAHFLTPRGLRVFGFTLAETQVYVDIGVTIATYVALMSQVQTTLFWKEGQSRKRTVLVTIATAALLYPAAYGLLWMLNDFTLVNLGKVPWFYFNQFGIQFGWPDAVFEWTHWAIILYMVPFACYLSDHHPKKRAP